MPVGEPARRDDDETAQTTRTHASTRGSGAAEGGAEVDRHARGVEEAMDAG
jgi:hypothetical protein